MVSLKTEADIKSALIDRLFAKGEVCSDAVFVSEMMIDGWARRADVVLANGKLSAFEVKSDFDSLLRLPGQIETYRAIFEKVVVVVAPRFAEKVEAMVPESIGVWIAEGDGAEGIKIRRQGRTEALSIEACLSLMTVQDLRLLLLANGFDGVSRSSRRELETVARKLTKKDLSESARAAVKRRFRKHHDKFVAHREKRGTTAALRFLKRPQRRMLQNESQPAIEHVVAEVPIPADHPALIHAPAGPILKRLRV